MKKFTAPMVAIAVLLPALAHGASDLPTAADQRQQEPAATVVPDPAEPAAAAQQNIQPTDPAQDAKTSFQQEIGQEYPGLLARPISGAAADPVDH